MNFISKLIVVSVLSCMLTACLGDVTSTSTTPATTTPAASNTGTLPVKLAMKSAIYEITNFPSGTLTLTTDSVDTDVFGKYSVIAADGTLVSAGSVSGTTSGILLSSPEGTSCKEKFIIDPLSITTDSTAEVSIDGVNCSNQAIVTTRSMTKVVDAAKKSTASATIRIDTLTNVNMTITVSSADNVNFLGTLLFTNEKLPPLSSISPVTANATVVGSITDSSDKIILINNGGTDLTRSIRFKVTNFAGHFLRATDILTFTEDPVKYPAAYTFISLSLGGTGSPYAGQYYVDAFNVHIIDSEPPAISMELGKNPSDALTLKTIIPYSPLLLTK